MTCIPRVATIALAVAVAPAAWSAGKAGSQAQQQYQQDRAYCSSGQATEPRALCLKEAARAYQEARRGTLEPGSGASQDSMDQRKMGASGSAKTKTKVSAKAKKPEDK